MRHIIWLMLGIAAYCAAYCEYGTRQKIYWNGGHQEAVYKFNSGKSFVLVCRGNAYDSCPYTIRYDFWTGEFCR